MAKETLFELCPDCAAAPPDAVWWHSVVSGETADPYVHLVVRSGGVSVAVQLTPEDARGCVVQGIEVVAAAEMDSGIYQFMAASGSDAEESRQRAGQLVAAVREFREKMRMSGGGKPS